MRRLHLGNVVAIALVALGAIALARGVKGETLWQLVECRPGLACRDRGAPLPHTACHTDAASLTFIVPDHTRIRCDRITDRKDGK